MLALVPALYLGAKLVTLVHELSHLLGAAVFGAWPQRLVVSILGGGLAQSDWTRLGGGSTLGHCVCTGAGILITILAGALVLSFSSRGRRPLAALLVSLLGSLAILDNLAYATLGLEHGFGDPGSILEQLGAYARPPRCTDRGLAWPFLAIAPLVAWLAIRAYARAQQRYFPAPRLWQRVLVSAVTLGALATPVALVAARQLATIDGTAARQCHRASLTRKLLDVYRRDGSTVDERQAVLRVLAQQRANPVPPATRPLAHLLALPLLLAALALGGTLALWRVPPNDPPALITRRELLLLWSAAGLAAGLLFALGQPLFFSALTD
jgi:hypothetical protein